METPKDEEQKPVVEIIDVTKTYTMGDNIVNALKGVSFKINQGEFVSIMGPSGSGKSTCMNMIGCLDRPTSGIVEINGKKTAKMTEKELAILRNQTIGFIFQQYHLIPSMTILENVMLPLKYRKVDKKERLEKSKNALKLVGLEQRMNHRPFELSGGQKQRAAIARAMVTEPKILLADEPTGALDTETGHQVMNMFREINEKNNTTIIIVTHDPRIGVSTERCIHILDGEIKSDNWKEEQSEQAVKKEEEKEACSSNEKVSSANIYVNRDINIKVPHKEKQKSDLPYREKYNKSLRDIMKKKNDFLKAMKEEIDV